MSGWSRAAAATHSDATILGIGGDVNAGIVQRAALRFVVILPASVAVWTIETLIFDEGSLWHGVARGALFAVVYSVIAYFVARRRAARQ
jgi:hypothetical protein